MHLVIIKDVICIINDDQQTIILEYSGNPITFEVKSGPDPITILIDGVRKGDVVKKNEHSIVVELHVNVNVSHSEKEHVMAARPHRRSAEDGRHIWPEWGRSGEKR